MSDLESAEKLNKTYGVYVAKSYDEFAGIVDGVMITARHGDNHYKYVKPYIKYGIPMFIDKPITISEQKAVILKKELIENNVKVSGGSVCKYPELVQNLTDERQEYDVDVIVLYDDTVSTKDLLDTVKQLTQSGRSVSAQRSVMQKQRYKELLRFTKEGVITVEKNA